MNVIADNRLDDRKPLFWYASTYKDYIAFPEEVQDDAGFQLDRVQQGLDPLDFSSESGVGGGVYKIRVRERGDTYRVFYVAKFEEAVYVLHCFKKKSSRGIATPKKDLDLARQRYKEVVASRPARGEEA